MRRNIRRLTLVLLSIAALLVLAAAVGVWYVGIRPLPTTRGDLNLPGLQAPVTVYRDSWGIPHIFAQNTDDLFMAQGYVQAGDRLWQMEFQRRTGHGRLSEILGDATLSTDRFLRTLGTTQAAQADLEIMDPQTRSYLDAYARGVNAYIEQQRGNLPIEFRLLGVKPEPWTPVDSLVWGKMIAWDLGGNWETELLRARIVAVLGAAAAQQLLPNYPASDPLIIPSEVHAYRDLERQTWQRRLPTSTAGCRPSRRASVATTGWSAARRRPVASPCWRTIPIWVSACRRSGGRSVCMGAATMSSAQEWRVCRASSSATMIVSPGA